MLNETISETKDLMNQSFDFSFLIPKVIKDFFQFNTIIEVKNVTLPVKKPFILPDGYFCNKEPLLCDNSLIFASYNAISSTFIILAVAVLIIAAFSKKRFIKKLVVELSPAFVFSIFYKLIFFLLIKDNSTIFTLVDFDFVGIANRLACGALFFLLLFFIYQSMYSSHIFRKLIYCTAYIIGDFYYNRYIFDFVFYHLFFNIIGDIEFEFINPFIAGALLLAAVFIFSFIIFICQRVFNGFKTFIKRAQYGVKQFEFKNENNLVLEGVAVEEVKVSDIKNKEDSNLIVDNDTTLVNIPLEVKKFN
jgi:hypothetical protein